VSGILLRGSYQGFSCGLGSGFFGCPGRTLGPGFVGFGVGFPGAGVGSEGFGAG